MKPRRRGVANGIDTAPPPPDDAAPALRHDPAHGIADDEPTPTSDAPDADLSDTLGDGALQEEIDALMRALPSRIDADPEKLEAGLARLVLTLIEFLRRALEHQAVKRMEAGSLSVEEEERLGLAFLKLKDRMVELRNIFDLEEEDLNLDLGPLGRLL